MVGILSKILSGLFSVKTLIAGLIVTTLGIILYNVVCDVIQEALTFALTKANGQSFSQSVNTTITGFSGWFLAQLKIPECISVIVSCVSIKFILRKIPFLNW